MKLSCTDCRFADWFMRVGDDNYYKCHRNPPVIDGFPTVDQDDWCGSWSGRPVEDL